MSYIDNNLIPDERIQFRTKKHIIIFLMPTLWTLFAIVASFYMTHYPMLAAVSWAPWLIALILWSYQGLEYMTSEFAVTNKRVMMREGFFYRHTNEMRLTSISQVNVEQSLLGQLLNYGTVSINAFGAFDAYPIISQPYRFQKQVNEQVDKALNAKSL